MKANEFKLLDSLIKEVDISLGQFKGVLQKIEFKAFSDGIVALRKELKDVFNYLYLSTCLI